MEDTSQLNVGDSIVYTLDDGRIMMDCTILEILSINRVLVQMREMSDLYGEDIMDHWLSQPQEMSFLPRSHNRSVKRHTANIFESIS